MISDKYTQAVLAALPATQAEIRDRAHLGKDSVRKTVQHLYRTKQCHIGGWAYIGKKPSAIYHAGPGKDAVPRPPQCKQPMPSAPLGSVRRDPLVAALFGEVVPC